MKPVRDGTAQVHEFELWRQAERALRQLPQEMQPPEHFAAQVMERIAREQITPLPAPSASGRSVDFRRWMASAALFLLAVGTGSGIYVAMQGSAPPGSAPVQVVQHADPSPEQSDSDIRRSTDRDGHYSGQGARSTELPPSTVSDRAVIVPQDATESSHPALAPVAPAPEPTKGIAATEKTYLLSKPMVIQRTLLRYRVASLDAGIDAVKKAVTQVNGQLENVSLQQSQGRTIQNLIVKLPPDRLQAFIQALPSGVLLENKRDNQDVTNTLQDMVALVDFLRGQLATAPAMQQPALSNKIQSLERQIASLEQEAATQTVVLMMEAESGQ
ncbi:hypothetical protein HM1_1125 [Heliomicrobium modesticaldum Ice1]|uniref:DUF4349 domain-containing protein n=1 Tax=Heliobacterium modesticaldum (strain ATCC 51547 / Ice1) TaxID=498761 RepID=B0THL1_HELMI|nr:DUF4349 domain-containing protein [Heliomicrobium modesticaldum]ABZ83449.1 hypothetical protein HM1_1125 [Heliomicrobium modesticaldum Ice1]